MEAAHSLSYADFLSLPPSERARYTDPVFSLLWFDEREIKLLRRHSWFDDLRSQMNQKGKVKFSIGVFQYEQAGSEDPPDESNLIEVAEELLTTGELVTPETFQALLREAVLAAEGSCLKPSLGLIDVALHLQFDSRALVDSYLRLIAEGAGYRIDGQLSPALYFNGDWVDQAWMILRTAASEMFSSNVVGAHWEQLVKNPQVFYRLRHRGQDYFKGVVPGRGAHSDLGIDYNLAIDPRALSTIPSAQGAPTRILGWIEHSSSLDYVVRPIAMASAHSINIRAEENVGSRDGA